MSAERDPLAPPVIDGHAYCFPPLDSPAGLPLEEKLRRIQQELGTHHSGVAQHLHRYEERRAAVYEARCRLIRARAFLEAHDLAVNTITGGGTGTFELEAATGVYNEVQPGSYVFNDLDYARNLDADGNLVSRWRQSLFVLASVIEIANASALRAPCSTSVPRHSASTAVRRSCRATATSSSSRSGTNTRSSRASCCRSAGA